MSSSTNDATVASPKVGDKVGDKGEDMDLAAVTKVLADSVQQTSTQLKEMRGLLAYLHQIERETTRDIRMVILDKAVKGVLPKSRSAAKPLTIAKPVAVSATIKTKASPAKARGKKVVQLEDETPGPALTVSPDFADFVGCAEGTQMTEKEVLSAIARYIDENMLVSEVATGKILLDRRLKVLLGMTGYHEPHATYFIIRQHIGKAFATA